MRILWVTVIFIFDSFELCLAGAYTSEQSNPNKWKSINSSNSLYNFKMLVKLTCILPETMLVLQSQVLLYNSKMSVMLTQAQSNRVNRHMCKLKICQHRYKNINIAMLARPMICKHTNIIGSALLSPASWSRKTHSKSNDKMGYQPQAHPKIQVKKGSFLHSETACTCVIRIGIIKFMANCLGRVWFF